MAGLVLETHCPDQRQETVQWSGLFVASGVLELRFVQILPMGQVEYSMTAADSEPSDADSGQMVDSVVQTEVLKVQTVAAFASNCQCHDSNNQVDFTLHGTWNSLY